VSAAAQSTGAGGEPKPKTGGKRKALIGALVAVLVIVVAGIAYGAYTVASQAKAQAQQADVMAASRAIDEDLAALWERFAGRDKAWDLSTANGGIGSLDNIVAMSQSDLELMKTSVAEIRTAAEAIPSESVSSAYVAVCDELDTALADAGMALTETQPICDAFALLSDSIEDGDKGYDAVNDSVNACNKEKYKDGKTYAKTAQTHFEAMRAKFTEASGLYSTGHDAQLKAYADACVEFAKMQHQLAVLGTQGSVSGYNAQIDKTEKQLDKCRELEGNVVSAMTVTADGAKDAYGSFEVRAATAKKLWSDAQELVTAGEY
jgi:hypothetical protein